MRRENCFAERSRGRVSNYSDDGQPRVLRCLSCLSRWKTPGYASADGIFGREHQIDKPLVDDGYRLTALDIAPIDSSAANQRNAHRLEISARDGTEGRGSEVGFYGSIPPLDHDTVAETRTVQWKTCSRRDVRHAWEVGDVVKDSPMRREGCFLAWIVPNGQSNSER